MLGEIGCRQKKWNRVDRRRTYQWVGNGKILEKRACIGENYRKNSVPEKGKTKVYTTIEYQRVRDVDAKKQTLFADMVLTMRWFDPNIKTLFLDENERKEGITITSEAIQKIWTPDLYIWNRTSVKEKEKSVLLIKAKLLSSLDVHDIDSPDSNGRKTS